jgi:hypothetical protein
MAGQAQAERERRAKIISAEGEYQASQRLHDAAERLESPTALQLRLFQTLNEISSEQNSTIILPVPIDLFRPYLDAYSDNGSHNRPPQARGREEREPERRYEEAVGEARSEHQAVQELGPNGATSPAEPAPAEEAATSAEAPRKAVPPDASRTEEPPPRTGDAPPSPSEQPPR